MGITRFIIALCVIPHVAIAEPMALTCEGVAPDWTLDLRENDATFSFLDRQSTMDIPQRSIAEGANWPKAMTLVGPRDSAIVILHQRNCEGQNYEAQVLTQRGETPILLTGCCVD